LLLQKIQTHEQQKWASKLQGFNFEIYYKPGKNNKVGDALSRKVCEDKPALMTISAAVPDIQDKFCHYFHSEKGQQHVQGLLNSNTDPKSYVFIKGLLYYKRCLFVPEDWRLNLLTEFHCTPLAGHSRVQPTMARLATSFF